MINSQANPIVEQVISHGFTYHATSASSAGRATYGYAVLTNARLVFQTAKHNHDAEIWLTDIQSVSHGMLGARKTVIITTKQGFHFSFIFNSNAMWEQQLAQVCQNPLTLSQPYPITQLMDITPQLTSAKNKGLIMIIAGVIAIVGVAAIVAWFVV